MKQKLYILFISLSVLIRFSYAKEHHYYYIDRNLLSSNIYSINLETGEKKVIFTTENKISYPSILSDHSKIIFKGQNKICVYNHQTGSVDTLSYLGSIEKMSGVYLVPSINEIYLDFIEKDAQVTSREYHEQEHRRISIDKNTYSFIEGISNFRTVKSLISKDGEKIFRLLESRDGIYFESRNIKSGPFNFVTFAIEGYENLQMKYNPYIIDSENGYAFIGYLSETDGNGHLVLCDPDNKISINHMTLPIGVPPYASAVSSNGDMVFQDYKGGEIYILEQGTAKLKQRIKVPPASENAYGRQISLTIILGDSLYFFPEDPKESDATSFDNIGHADLTIVQTSSSLIDMLIDDVEEAREKGWITNQGIVNSLDKKLENAKKQLEKGKIKTAVNHLNAFLNEVEAQKDKHLSKEAYALLKFNAEYLVQRLEEE